MVGAYTGNVEVTTVKAIEAVDKCIGKIFEQQKKDIHLSLYVRSW